MERDSSAELLVRLNGQVSLRFPQADAASVLLGDQPGYLVRLFRHLFEELLRLLVKRVQPPRLRPMSKQSQPQRVLVVVLP